MKKLFFLTAGLLMITTSGCTTRVGDFTVLSTKNIDFDSSSGYKTLQNQRVKGIDAQNIIVFIPTGGPPNVKEAVDNAIHSKPDCFGLANAVVYQKIVVIPCLFGRVELCVEGDPIVPRNKVRQ